MKRILPMAAALTALNFVYAGTSVCTKMASRTAWMSKEYVLWMAGAVGVMGLYALLWQQALARVPLAAAYVFRGTSLIFILLLSAWLFGEPVTARNAAGAVLIVCGIALHAGA